MVRVLSGVWLILILTLAGCIPAGAPAAPLPPAAEASPAEVLPSPAANPLELPTAQITPPLLDDRAPNTATPQPTATGAPAASATPVPTYVYLRGKVLVDQANCRYGPGWPYLYKYGVYRDSVLEIIGRNEAGTWVLIRGVGGTNACWVKASLLQIRGDVQHVAPTDVPLPPSPYYGPLTGVLASREGDTVTVSWNPLYLRAGDDSEQVPYVVEAWVCRDGRLVFEPVGSYATTVAIVDEWGCSEPSHARVTAAEKHGYTAYVEVAWPPAVAPGEE